MNAIIVSIFACSCLFVAAESAAAYYPVKIIEEPNKYDAYQINTNQLAKSEVRDANGQYSLSYVTADGTKVSERAYLKPNYKGELVLAKEGTYSYTSPDGVPVSYSYTADERGFLVSGSPLPVAPAPAPAPAPLQAAAPAPTFAPIQYSSIPAPAPFQYAPIPAPAPIQYAPNLTPASTSPYFNKFLYYN